MTNLLLVRRGGPYYGYHPVSPIVHWTEEDLLELLAALDDSDPIAFLPFTMRLRMALWLHYAECVAWETARNERRKLPWWRRWL